MSIANVEPASSEAFRELLELADRWEPVSEGYRLCIPRSAASLRSLVSVVEANPRLRVQVTVDASPSMLVILFKERPSSIRPVASATVIA
jgi:hypothetical protein